jgi:hypothetical protein
LSFYAAALTKQTNFKDIYGAGIVGATLVYVNEEDCKICYLNRKDLNYYFKVFKEILRDFYGVKKLEKSWRQMVSHANGRYNYETGEYENNIPKEIMLVKN